MKKFASKYGQKIALGLGIVAAIAPLSAFAAFTDGMVLPTGTTTNVTSAIATYFFTTVLATVFQQQVIEIGVVLAAVGLMVWVVKFIISKIHHPGR